MTHQSARRRNASGGHCCSFWPFPQRPLENRHAENNWGKVTGLMHLDLGRLVDIRRTSLSCDGLAVFEELNDELTRCLC